MVFIARGTVSNARKGSELAVDLNGNGGIGWKAPLGREASGFYHYRASPLDRSKTWTRLLSIAASKTVP